MIDEYIMSWLRAQPWYDHDRDHCIHHCMEYIKFKPGHQPGSKERWEVTFLNHLYGHDDAIPDMKVAAELEYSRIRRLIRNVVNIGATKMRNDGAVPEAVYLSRPMHRFIQGDHSGSTLVGLKVHRSPTDQSFILSEKKYRRWEPVWTIDVNTKYNPELGGGVA